MDVYDIKLLIHMLEEGLYTITDDGFFVIVSDDLIASRYAIVKLKQKGQEE